MAAPGLIEDFDLPASLEAAEPPEARGLERDAVRLLVSDTSSDTIEHARFRDLPRWLSRGDLLVVNTSGTLSAALPVEREAANGQSYDLHLSTRLPGGFWSVELRQFELPGLAPERRRAARHDAAVTRRRPRYAARALPADLDARFAVAALAGRARSPEAGQRVPRSAWLSNPLQVRAGAVADRDVSDHLRHRAWQRGDALGRTPVHRRTLVSRLVCAVGFRSRRSLLHTGVASLEDHEPPYEEFYRVPAETARTGQCREAPRPPRHRGRDHGGSSAGDGDRRSRRDASG